MEWEAVLKPALAEQFEQAMRRGRAVLFSAPCGFGKTTTARALLSGRRVWAVSPEEGNITFPAAGEWEVLLVDDLQRLIGTSEQEALCRLIRECSDKRFVLLTRGTVPNWLLPFQMAGVMTVFGPSELAFDRETTQQLLQQRGVSATSLDLAAIQKATKGCPAPLVLLIPYLLRGELYQETVADQVRRDLFFYFEERVYGPLERDMQHLLLDLAPFEPFCPELARIVSGNSRAGELLGKFQRESSAILQERLDRHRFWPIFRRFLLWELEQTYDEGQRRALYNRGGLYYELNEDYGKALECYSKSGDTAKISELLAKNAEMHPGMGHYEEMEPYYRALPEQEIRSSPALMQAMSMLCALTLDVPASEKWYQALRDFLKHCRRTDADYREARSRLAWLDLSLPQRKVEGMVDTFVNVFHLLSSREIKLPAFSVTSSMPSLMNGSKDFSPWSQRDDVLYATLCRPAEAVLGRDGVCLADCAIAESKYEKGENIKDRVLALLSNLERIRREGTPDLELAVVGLLARTQLDGGSALDAKRTLLTLRERFAEQGESRFLPNLDAMICRVELYLGNDEEADQWYREKAPKNPQKIHGLQRYQYITQARVELALGDEAAARTTLAPLRTYFTACARYIDNIHLHILSAIARFRQREEAWRADLSAALETAEQFRFIRPISQYGGAVLPLLSAYIWEGEEDFWERLMAAVREQASLYPDYLRPRREMIAPLSPTETQVLRLLCAGKSNGEIGAILNIKTATVKVHVNHIFGKLGVKHREEARETAKRLRLVEREVRNDFRHLTKKQECDIL